MAASSACSGELSSDSDSGGEENEPQYVLGSDCPAESTLSGVLNKILYEDIVMKSSRGGEISEIVTQCLHNIQSREMNSFVSVVFEKMKQCCGSNGKPVSLSSIWRKFHALRLSSVVREEWKTCMVKFGIQSGTACDATLQVLLRRLLQAIVVIRVVMHAQQ